MLIFLFHNTLWTMENPDIGQFKFEKALVPMARGGRSTKVFRIALDMAREYSTEITAFTVRDEKRDLLWTEKVNLITEAYRVGKSMGLKVIPKIVSSDSTKVSIIKESEAHSYDYILIATTRRSPLSGALFGNIGDYVFTNSKVPVAMLSTKGTEYPYKSAIIPISETLSTRYSILFALHLKKAIKYSAYMMDLRKYDKKKTHGFKLLMDRFPQLSKIYGENISYASTGRKSNVQEEIMSAWRQYRSDVLILGIRPGPSGRIRVPLSMRSIIKQFPGDVIIVKRG